MTIPLPELKEELSKLASIPDSEWRASLEERKLKELEFHDRDRDRAAAQIDADTYGKLHANRKYYSVTRRSSDYVDEWLRRHSPGKVVLDYACGNGGHAMRAAKAGAALAIGLDISRVSIENAAKDAVIAGLEGNTFFVQGDCENTGLPSGSIDVVICSGMLHHLDLSYAFPELRRIMKPGGVLLAVEALDVNPAVKLYRKLTPGLRTEWEKEHILSHADLRFARRFFDVRNVRYWHLFAIPAALIRGTPLFSPMFALGDAIDAVVLRMPFVRWLAWQFTFELWKRPE